eukprot:COSAG02_NODE_15165_length_1196_cov_0.951774_1_plen_258_part_10
MACPRRCDVVCHLLLTSVTSPLRATTPSAPLGRAESLFAHARVCARAAHLLRAHTAANQHLAQHRPTPRDPTFHPLKRPPARHRQRCTIAPGAPSRVPTTLTPAPPTPTALPAARAPPAQLFPAPAQRTQPPWSVVSEAHTHPNRTDHPPSPPSGMAGDSKNSLQARPCIPLPRLTPRNRPRTPPAARTGLQAARAPRRPSCCAEPPPLPILSRASADGQEQVIRRDTARPYTRPALSGASVVPRSPLGARGEALPAA